MNADDRIGWGRLLFGPWPLMPLPVFALGALAYLNRSVLVAGVSAQGGGEFGVTLAALIGQGVLVTLVASAPIVLLGGWRHALTLGYRPDRVPSRARYLLAAVLAALIVAVAQVLSRYLALDEVTGRGVFESIPLAFVASFALVLLFALGIFSAVGYVSWRIGRQTRQLERQVVQLEEQRRMVVEADQQVRGEVADALHNDVQGALLRATLRLSRLVEASGDPDQAAALRAVIADLEELRGAGVRAIGRRLQPPIASVGLVTALEELAGTYRGTIDVTVDLDPATERSLEAAPPDRAIALYRIVEQALLNASAHGRAHAATVRVRCADGTCRLAVEDDGVGLADAIVAGHGTAVIDAWAGAVGGSWRLEPAGERGARVCAEIRDTQPL